MQRPEKEGLLQKVMRCLQFARQMYFTPLEDYILPLLGDQAEEMTAKMQRSFDMAVAFVLPWEDISSLMNREFTKEALVILGIDVLNVDLAGQDGDEMDVDWHCSYSYQHWRDQPDDARVKMMGEDMRAAAARERLLSLLYGLQHVGLGGIKSQRVLGGVVNTMMNEFIRAAYSRHWESPTSAPQHLRQWITGVFTPLVAQVLTIINPEDPGSGIDAEVAKWQEIGISRLGALRTGELFDIIVEWPASSGALEDLRHFTMSPPARFFVTHAFIDILNTRLLHPGASTGEILQVYISIIRAFNLLDPRGVLLDRIARPIRRYLRDRDDTVKVIVSGLLATPADAEQAGSASAEILMELSTELSKAHQRALQSNTGELDWDDMAWMPDPVDAAPDYRKSKSSDVIGSLISLFESKEMFVKEMQNILGDRLLQKREEFDQEMSVLELLKLRFGDNALQACEVMLRDIFDSRRVDITIRHDQGLGTKNVQAPELHAKILSHFFWPDIQEQEFKVPDDILQLQQRYAGGFESLKQSRKLTWLNGMGQVTVELDLEDRVFVDEVATWQATVIDAFHSPSNDPVTKSIEQLSHDLGMTAPLVRSACLFWVSKRILTEVHRDTFRVLETLPSDDDPGHAMDEHEDAAADTADARAAADAAEAAAAKESAEAAALEKMHVHWQFIVGMLTNQGAMPLSQIVMMLKMAVPGGFPFSHEELREFLAGMVGKGKLEVVSGGNYRLVSA